MQVLKKFGVLIFICLLAGLNTYAQTADDCGRENTVAQRKIDPIDFIHNHLLKMSPKPLVDSKNTYAVSSKTKVLQLKKGPSDKLVALPAKSVAQVKASDKKTLIPETDKIVTSLVTADKKMPPVTLTTIISSDLLNNRTVTKTVAAPKKEENSFGSSMMDWVQDKYSCMIEVLPNQISNVMLYHFIDDWYGVKYRMGGTSKKGVDCSAFVQTLYKYVFGMDLLRTACLQFNSSELIKNPADLKEGDLVFFKVNSSRISHVGVYLKNNFFVHSASSKGVSIANLTSAYWSKYFAGGGRILNRS